MNNTLVIDNTLIKKRPFKAIISIVTAAAFLVSTFSYDIAWAFTAPLVSPGSMSYTEDGQDQVKELHPDTFTLPAYLGTVQHKFTADAPKKTVIHIQDAHCNYACQMRVSEIIGYLNEEYGISAVNLEGGAGEYDQLPSANLIRQYDAIKV